MATDIDEPRTTLAHCADELHGSIQRLHGLLDKLDGGIPEADSMAKVQSLTDDFDTAHRDLESACRRLADVVERIGRVL